MVRGHTGGGGGTHSYHHVSSRVSGGSGGGSSYDLPLSAHSLGSSSLAGSAGYGGAGLGGAGVGRAGVGHHHTPSYHRLPVSHFVHSSSHRMFFIERSIPIKGFAHHLISQNILKLAKLIHQRNISICCKIYDAFGNFLEKYLQTYVNVHFLLRHISDESYKYQLGISRYLKILDPKLHFPAESRSARIFFYFQCLEQDKQNINVSFDL